MPDAAPLRKCPTGIPGFDDVLGGGLPHGRPTLVCGSAGCGKTLLAVQFLERGATLHGEPGVFVAFEETAKELAENVTSLGLDLGDLAKRRLILVDHVQVDREQVRESGAYDLEGLFIRLGHAIDSIGAKRVVLDTVELLFSSLSNPVILRSELHRLFTWLKQRGVTTIVTGERGGGNFTRQGLEEYVSDCVVLLDHRVDQQVSTRRLRVVKYRGSTHGTNEYPFLIDERGISVLPITTLGLEHTASDERVPSGIARLDTMLGGRGFFRGSSILISGTAGTGKSSISARFAETSCLAGRRTLYFAFEEAPSQIVRNMRSIGIDLAHCVDTGLLRFHAVRPSTYGLEMHLTTMYREFKHHLPEVVVVDPVNSFVIGDNETEVKSMLVRLVDFLKGQGVTSMFTSLTTGGVNSLEFTDVAISSLIDTWVLLRDQETDGERNRVLYVLKSRGMAHSNQVREFVLTGHGIELRDVYVGSDGVLTGSARLAREARDLARRGDRDNEVARKRRELERKRVMLEAKIAALQAEFALEEDEATQLIALDESAERRLAENRREMAHARWADDEVALQPDGSRTSGQRS